MRVFVRTDDLDRDTRAVQANEHRKRRQVIALNDIVVDAKGPYRHGRSRGAAD
jgi:hypothetical protein